jgi:ankyrin repeat protein
MNIFEACRNCNLERVKEIIESGSDVNIQNID